MDELDPLQSASIVTQPSEAEDAKPSGILPVETVALPHLRRPRRRLFPLWFRRRWWVLILCLAAGTGGGYFAHTSQTMMYSGSAKLVVASGASGAGPGSANDAIALALTYASIIPSDQLELRQVADVTGVPLRTVSKSVSAAAVSGTSVITVSFKAASESGAIADVNAVAEVITHETSDSAIPEKSLVVVKLANSASQVGTLHSLGVPLGAVLGLLVGVIALLAIERADPRVDDVEDLAALTGTVASAFPGPIHPVELARSIALASGEAAQVVLVPLTKSEEAQTEFLWTHLSMSSRGSSTALSFVGGEDSRNALLAETTGPTVLVVKRNARSRLVHSSVIRLQTLGREPVWAVLVIGKLKPKKRK